MADIAATPKKYKSCNALVFPSHGYLGDIKRPYPGCYASLSNPHKKSWIQPALFIASNNAKKAVLVGEMIRFNPEVDIYAKKDMLIQLPMNENLISEKCSIVEALLKKKQFENLLLHTFLQKGILSESNKLQNLLKRQLDCFQIEQKFEQNDILYHRYAAFDFETDVVGKIKNWEAILSLILKKHSAHSTALKIGLFHKLVSYLFGLTYTDEKESAVKHARLIFDHIMKHAGFLFDDIFPYFNLKVNPEAKQNLLLQEYHDFLKEIYNNLIKDFSKSEKGFSIARVCDQMLYRLAHQIYYSNNDNSLSQLSTDEENTSLSDDTLKGKKSTFSQALELLDMSLDPEGCREAFITTRKMITRAEFHKEFKSEAAKPEAEVMVDSTTKVDRLFDEMASEDEYFDVHFESAKAVLSFQELFSRLIKLQEKLSKTQETLLEQKAETGELEQPSLKKPSLPTQGERTPGFFNGGGSSVSSSSQATDEREVSASFLQNT